LIFYKKYVIIYIENKKRKKNKKMKVLNIKKFQREGNDCLIQVIISLTQVFDCYTIYIHTIIIYISCFQKTYFIYINSHLNYKTCQFNNIHIFSINHFHYQKLSKPKNKYITI
jgi:hypothetical protein